MTLRDRSANPLFGKLVVKDAPIAVRFSLAHRMLQDAVALGNREIRDCDECGNIVSAEVIRIAEGAILRKNAATRRTIDLTQRDFLWPSAPRTLIAGLSNNLFEQHTQHLIPEE